jgi:PAS domain S-box-containing protein
MEALISENFSGTLSVNEVCYQNALDEIDDGLIIVDRAEIIQFVNRAASSLLGYTKDELLNYPLGIFYQSVFDTSVEALIQHSGRQVNQSEQIPFLFKLLPAKNGMTIPIEEKISCLLDPSNEPNGKFIQFKNLTEIRKTELKSLASKDSYLKILENGPLLICRLNTDGQFNYFNYRWLEFTGRNIENEIYRGWTTKIHPDDRPGFEEVLNSAITGQKSLKTDFRLLNREGEYRWLFCHLNPFFDTGDNYSGYIFLCSDITDRKNMEIELRKAKELSDAANYAKSNFFSNMSHEIRTPLNSIMGLTDVLFDTKLDDEQTEFLSIIKQSSHTLLALLNNLLESSRLEENKEKLNENFFSLPEIIESIFSLFKYQAEQSNVLLSYKIEDNTPIQIYGDSQKLKQIIINLTSNAVKFTKSGFVNLQIFSECIPVSMKTGTQDIQLHFVLTDSGIGISEDKQDMIFESFTQVDSSSTREYSGAGLGLAIVKRLTELMDGHIYLESKLGKGSCFHVILNFQTAGITQ